MGCLPRSPKEHLSHPLRKGSRTLKAASVQLEDVYYHSNGNEEDVTTFAFMLKAVSSRSGQIPGNFFSQNFGWLALLFCRQMPNILVFALSFSASFLYVTLCSDWIVIIISRIDIRITGSQGTSSLCAVHYNKLHDQSFGEYNYHLRRFLPCSFKPLAST